MLRLYNTLGRKLEIFKPLKKTSVGLYTCGPTVYNYAHIGNLRTYVFEDILERVLKADGYRVKRVMNITDVGHLTSDADEGEDKLEKGAKRENKSVLEIAKFYTEAFLSDIRALNIAVPKILAPATQFIPDQVALVEQLMKKGVAYETSTAVYFDVTKFKAYGKLAGQSLKDKMTAARKEVVTDPAKRNPADFALWFKRVGKFANHMLHWPSPWGEGFPGWHVECSAIGKHFLGQPFDIHTGGVDHIGTHHTNEIAQSQAAYGVPLARYWMHGEFLLVERGKMAKSAGNFYTLADIKARGIPPLAFRYLALGAHYRSRLNFTWESLEAAQNGLQNLYNKIHQLSWDLKELRGIDLGGIVNAKPYENLFNRAINNDLNTPMAMSIMQTLLGVNGISIPEKLTLIKKFDRVLGLDLDKSMKLVPSKIKKIPKEVRELAKKREEYRRSKQFMQADALRKRIGELGYTVEDTPQGFSLCPLHQK
ncbi:MAG: cysteine--tRNA ligase [Candidatus Liptonbacteria bacterium RIFCSPLOWO2_01_FULL_53_13]|uniref:Cysteine--tRNA ligase n=1 Tax=Candidatus Liptonbacteria bacterium RIFCSPLOWO2_01_FULL_53_13 TaxID=1798651 RepID=A0A1G2CIT4_9BACT|nr:MAG: cysteine--tRNA ligase [Candidatus Liptonbacteria bacterium RIFCSPLOWO2_01_FULL_53_13]